MVENFCVQFDLIYLHTCGSQVRCICIIYEMKGREKIKFKFPRFGFSYASRIAHVRNRWDFYVEVNAIRVKKKRKTNNSHTEMQACRRVSTSNARLCARSFAVTYWSCRNGVVILPRQAFMARKRRRAWSMWTEWSAKLRNDDVQR